MSPSELQDIVAQKHVGVYEASGPRIEKVRQVFAGFKDKKKVLDVGCADGSILAPFVLAHELHGVDISKGLVAKACAAGVGAVQHDVETKYLPYPHGSFAIEFSCDTIKN